MQPPQNQAQVAPQNRLHFQECAGTVRMLSYHQAATSSFNTAEKIVLIAAVGLALQVQTSAM